MSEIRLENLTKHFGDVRAVENMTLVIPDGSFTALLGPSGCGKTTTMNMISGLERPTSGEIYFDDQPVSKVDPGSRNVGFVFQNYAIFTHMTVYENISFGLRVRKDKPSNEQIDREVRSVAETVGVTNILDAKAGRLSVNDMQKVALGRSMIVEPEIFLLDEPFSNLDAAFRAYMRAALKRIQHEIGQTMVYVTHDQIEAMSMADKIAVMDLGELQQYAPPEEIYNRPANRFVANFVGSVLINFLPAHYGPVDGRAEVRVTGKESRPVDVTNRKRQIEERVNDGGSLTLGIRPENVQLVAPDSGDAIVRAKVVMIEALGAKDVAHLSSETADLRAVTVPDNRPRVGDNVGIAVLPDDVHLFDDNTGLVLR